MLQKNPLPALLKGKSNVLIWVVRQKTLVKRFLPHDPCPKLGGGGGCGPSLEQLKGSTPVEMDPAGEGVSQKNI